ncbi:MAG: 4'-phosphopantetheinyl transferase superfamily protein [Rhodospirillaceae bacterium]|nr:4'-phosphopantetheinyl transferase superfamily protein [Rhodospirillaceae bacterium]
MTDCNRWWRPWREARDSLILHVDLRPDPGHEEQALAVLDDEEQARWHRFVVKGARRRFALCRAALRINLCDRLGCSNRELSFGYLEHGKPFAKINGVPSSASFNVSHSGRHGLIGFTKQEGLGVDLELRAPGRDFDGIGSSVYGPRERRALSAAAGSDKEHLFYRFWSLKEALIKALGTGFSLGPSRFEIPRSIIEGQRSAVFRFPHLPSEPFWLEDLGEPRFAAARAYRLKAQDSGPDGALSQG